MSSLMLQGNFAYQDQYSRALSAAYRWYYRITDPDWALEQDVDTWRKIWRDPQLAQAMQIRLHMVAGREWQVVPGNKNPTEEDKFAAELVADAMGHLKKFGEARSLLAQAVFHGTSWAFLEGKRITTVLNGMKGEWWVPSRLRNMNKGRFIYVPRTYTNANGDEQIMVETHLFPVADPNPRPITARFRERLCKVVYMDEESRLGYGRGLLETVYFLWWAKQEVMKEGLKAIERWAGGLIMAKTDLNAQPGADGRDSDTVREDFAKVLEAQRSRHVMVVDNEDQVEAVANGTPGANMVMDMLNYIDQRMTGVVLGSVLPYGVNEGTGSQARSQTEQDTTSILIAYDQDNVSESLTECVVGNFWRMNKPQLKAAGVGNAKMPRFKIMIEKREDYQQNAMVIQTVLNAGIPLKKQEIYERVGFTEPDVDDEVIEKAADPFGGGPPGAGSPFGNEDKSESEPEKPETPKPAKAPTP